jgi:SPP1 family predicted phage head-tail adaptor
MNIGKLNRRITITSFGANTPTATGGYTKGAETSVTTWCGAKPLSQSESLLNGLQIGQRNYEFTLRYEQGTTITQETKLTYETRTFKVASILEIDENKRVVKVLASERTN